MNIKYSLKKEIQNTQKSHDIKFSVMHLKQLVDESEGDLNTLTFGSCLSKLFNSYVL
jgi:hypothetical protein